MSGAAVVLCVVAFHSVRPLLANKMFVHTNVRRTPCKWLALSPACLLYGDVGQNRLICIVKRVLLFSVPHAFYWMCATTALYCQCFFSIKTIYLLT